MRKIILLAMSVGALALPMASCGEPANTAAAEQTFGPSPTLPAPQTSWIPTVNVATATSWPAGAKPTAANGMAVNAFATGLDHPRTVYVLPNGDVLVAETNAPPKPDDTGGIKGWITKLVMGRAGAGVVSPNRITLLRDADGDGVAEFRSVFIEGLHSPFGMALVGDDFYVADSDAIMKFPYHTGDTKITTPGVKLADLPAGASTITGPRISPPAPTGQNFMRPSAPTAMSAKTVSRPRPIAPPCSKSIVRPASGAHSRRAFAIRTGLPGSRRAARCGLSSMSATNSATISSRTT